MRKVLVGIAVLLGSLNAMATSYSTSPVAGYLTWNSSYATDYWTPRIPYLAHPGGDPNMWPSTFTTSNLSVTCTPTCGIGDKFSIDLSMSNISLATVGTINLVTAPITVKAQSGVVIAHFNLTGTLCQSSICSPTYFFLNVDVHGFAKVAYSLNSGQLTVSSVTYVLPEPTGVALLGTGLVFILAGMLGSKRMLKN